MNKPLLLALATIGAQHPVSGFGAQSDHWINGTLAVARDALIADDPAAYAAWLTRENRTNPADPDNRADYCEWFVSDCMERS